MMLLLAWHWITCDAATPPAKQPPPPPQNKAPPPPQKTPPPPQKTTPPPQNKSPPPKNKKGIIVAKSKAQPNHPAGMPPPFRALLFFCHSAAMVLCGLMHMVAKQIVIPKRLRRLLPLHVSLYREQIGGRS